MSSASLRAAPAAPQFEIGFGIISDTFRRWMVESRTRSALRALTDRQLADLGIARSEINRIARDAARTV